MISIMTAEFGCFMCNASTVINLSVSLHWSMTRQLKAFDEPEQLSTSCSTGESNFWCSVVLLVL